MVGERKGRAKSPSATIRFGNAAVLSASYAPILAAIYAAPAVAADWQITPSIAVTESVTDNAPGNPRGSERADAFTTVTPGVSVREQSARVNLSLDYSVTGYKYIDNSNLDTIQHNLLAGGTTELMRQLLFLDAQASVSRQSISATGPQSANNAPLATNSTTVKTYTLSPYLRNHLGSFADSEFRYGFSQFYAGALNDTTTNRFTETLTSGEEFNRFRWVGLLDSINQTASTTSASQAALTGTAGSSFHRLASFAPQYALDRYFILLGSVGYEKISDATLTNQPDGPIGSAGIRVNPGPRSSFSVLANHRFDSNYLTGDASYILTPTTRIDAAITRDISTTQSQFAQNLSYLATDQTGGFVDTRTQQAFIINNPAFSLTNASFLDKRASVRMTTDLLRDSFFAEIYRESHSSGVATSQELVYGGRANWNHELQPLLNLFVTVQYADEKFDALAGREDQTYNGEAGLHYSLSETLHADLTYDFIYRFSNVPQGGLREDIVTLGLKKTF